MFSFIRCKTPHLFQTKQLCLLPSMSAASGAAAIKMAEFQSGQYKLWPCQLMAELYYPCRAKGMWSELSPNCQLPEDPCFHLTDCLELQIKMGLASMFYQHIGKRTSTFALAVCVGAIGFERGFDRSERFILLDRTWEPVYVTCQDCNLSVLLTTSGKQTTKASFGRTSEPSMRQVKRRRE